MIAQELNDKIDEEEFFTHISIFRRLKVVILFFYVILYWFTNMVALIPSLGLTEDSYVGSTSFKYSKIVSNLNPTSDQSRYLVQYTGVYHGRYLKYSISHEEFDSIKIVRMFIKDTPSIEVDIYYNSNHPSNTYQAFQELTPIEAYPEHYQQWFFYLISPFMSKEIYLEEYSENISLICQMIGLFCIVKICSHLVVFLPKDILWKKYNKMYPTDKKDD